jgi:hypothetical protein
LRRAIFAMDTSVGVTIHYCSGAGTCFLLGEFIDACGRDAFATMTTGEGTGNGAMLSDVARGTTIAAWFGAQSCTTAGRGGGGGSGGG